MTRATSMSVSAPVDAPRVDPAAERERFLAAVTDCLAVAAPGAAASCLDHLDGTLDADELRELLCSAEIGHTPASHVLARWAIGRWEPSDVLHSLEDLDGSCEALTYASDFFACVLLDLRDSDPVWYERFVRGLTEADVFRPGPSAFGARLVGLLAAGGTTTFERVPGGDASLLPMLDRAATGELAVTRAQADQATMYAFLARESAEEGFVFLDGVLASHGLEMEPVRVQMVVALLLKAPAWPQGDPSLALELVRSALLHPTLGEHAASYLAGTYGAAPPRGISDAAWASLWELVAERR